SGLRRRSHVFASTPAPSASPPVVTLADDRRVAFMVKVYQHIALALAVFVGLEVLLFVGGIAEMLFDFFFIDGGGATWLLMLGGLMVVNWFAAQAGSDLADVGRQYMGLLAIAAGQSVIFAPFLLYVFNYEGTAP